LQRWSWRKTVSVSCGRGRKKKKKNLQKLGEDAGFLADFGPEFLPPQVFNRDSIYRRCKRAILSTLWKNYSSWFSWEASQPLAQSVHLELPNLAAPGCELPEVATSGQWTDPFITFSTRPDHSPG
jgi:hypothetical protein